MSKTNNGSPSARNIILGVIVTAYFCRLLSNYSEGFSFLGFLRSVLYIGLFAAWGFSLNRRVIQKKVKQYLISVVVLLIFWNVIKTLKYLIVTDSIVSRYLWYLYYVPMLLIPLMVFLAGWLMGQPDDCQLPCGLRFLWVPKILLVLLVLTNDLHQQVFCFVSSQNMRTFDNDTYTYGVGYYIVMVWMVLLAMAALGIMTVRCRVSIGKKKIVRPLIPVICLIVYGVIYISGMPAVRFLAGDLCIVFGLLYMAACESLIRYRLIQSNSRYADLFNASTDSSAQITDRDYVVHYAAREAKEISKEQMRMAEKGPVMLSDTVRLHNMQIPGGHVIWHEDISELLRVRKELEETQEELKDRNALLKLEYERDKERKTIEEQNRIYDLLNRCTQRQTAQIALLVKEYEKEEKDASSNREILACITVLCSYIKRRKHLALSVYSDCNISFSELQSALNESLKALELLSVRTGLYTEPGTSWLEGEIASLAYDFFESAVELALNSLRWIFVSVSVLDQKLRIAIRLRSSANMTLLSGEYKAAEIEREDQEEWSLIQVLEGGKIP